MQKVNPLTYNVYNWRILWSPLESMIIVMVIHVNLALQDKMNKLKINEKKTFTWVYKVLSIRETS